ncbi:hypothetical protein [Echinicola shivajiensis]|uniref:hypothetical protein n=1 Tax=Echinicola shivajiensis TaxID=1035916 RepID=UPI001BFC4D44|nr:hypothetical protein [Echinicola shivajiensis]
MEINTIVRLLRENGRVCVQEGVGKKIELINPDHYDEVADQSAIYLLTDLFQIRALAGQFSEIALDIVEYATKPTIYTSLASPLLSNGPVEDGKVKFSILKQGFWNKVVFSFSRPLLYKEAFEQEEAGLVKDKFPLFRSDVKRLFLSPDGDVKIGD